MTQSCYNVIMQFNSLLISSALTRDNIRCERNGIRFMANPSDFPRWNGDELQIGTCRLSSDFTGFASYEKCGIKTQERRKFLSYWLIKTKKYIFI